MSNNSVICVDYSIAPVYPDWVKKVMYPELEEEGPVEYSPKDDLKLWINDEQRSRGRAIGLVIHHELGRMKTHAGLGACLGLHDALEIQKRGCGQFEKDFDKTQSLVCWKAVVVGPKKQVFVPLVFTEGNFCDGYHVRIQWRSLAKEFYYYDMIASFRKRYGL